MGKLRWLGLIALAGVAGCGREDAEKLARIGRLLTGKVQAVLPDRTPFGSSWGTGVDRGLDDRVRSRIQADRYLASQNLQVIATAGGVRLKGQVADDVLKRRALEIAESTVGVEKVADELTVP